MSYHLVESNSASFNLFDILYHNNATFVTSPTYHIRHVDEKHSMVVIISNTEVFPHPRKAKRDNTEQDVAKLRPTFDQLGFEVHTYENQTKYEMEGIMKEGM